MTFTVTKNGDGTYNVETQNLNYCGITYENVPPKELGECMDAIADYVNNEQGEECVFAYER